MSGPEQVTQRAIIDLAETLGYYVHHDRPAQYRDGSWATHIQGDAGFPDLVLLHESGALVVLEVKSKAGRLSDAQARWMDRFELLAILSDGQVRVGVVRPTDLQRVADMLTGARDRARELAERNKQ